MKKFYLLLALLLGALTANAVTITKDTKLYFKTNSSWSQGDAWYAAYFYTDGVGDEWKELTLTYGETDIYEVTPSKSFEHVIFCRMNPAKTALEWGSKWNQTADLTWDGEKSLFYDAAAWWDTANDNNWLAYTAKYPETLYVHGTLAEGSWDPSKGYALTKEAEGVFSGTITLVDNGEFAFNEKNGTKSDDWATIDGGARWCAVSGSATVASGSEVKFKRGNDVNFKVTIPTGETSVTVPVLVDLTTNTLTINGEVTGIKEVGVDSGEAVYYNLQGVKVANPENGIFIKKQAGKTTKVVL